MRFSDKVATAWSNLGRRKVRTALTSVGVVVGITTVVTMVSLVNGVQRQVNQQFEKIGLDRVTVRPRGGGGFGGGGAFSMFDEDKAPQLITPADVKRWKAWPEVRQALPEVELPFGVITRLSFKDKEDEVRVSNANAIRRGPFAEAPEAVAGTLELPDAKGAVVVSQMMVKRIDARRRKPADFIGQTVTCTLIAPRGERQSYSLKVVGVTNEDSRSIRISTPTKLEMKSWWLNNPNILKEPGYDSVSLRAADVGGATELVKRLRKEKLQVQSIDAILDAANRIFAVITAMLAMVSSVALLVASIGIVNTMIMSIYERTREIGTLKAMGASAGDIRAMFMMEAGLIGLLGGVVGLFLSWLLGRGLNFLGLWYAKRQSLPLPENLFIITPALALEAVLFAVMVGVVAGLYPANRAAKLDPLKALRYE